MLDSNICPETQSHIICPIAKYGKKVLKSVKIIDDQSKLNAPIKIDVLIVTQKGPNVDLLYLSLMSCVPRYIQLDCILSALTIS